MDVGSFIVAVFRAVQDRSEGHQPPRHRRTGSSPLTWCIWGDPSSRLGQAAMACRVCSAVTPSVVAPRAWARARTSNPVAVATPGDTLTALPIHHFAERHCEQDDVTGCWRAARMYRTPSASFRARRAPFRTWGILSGFSRHRAGLGPQLPGFRSPLARPPASRRRCRI